jgi:hypothetical protein
MTTTLKKRREIIITSAFFICWVFSHGRSAVHYFIHIFVTRIVCIVKETQHIIKKRSAHLSLRWGKSRENASFFLSVLAVPKSHNLLENAASARRRFGTFFLRLLPPVQSVTKIIVSRARAATTAAGCQSHYLLFINFLFRFYYTVIGCSLFHFVLFGETHLNFSAPPWN